ncbi:MAG: hypothetical protein EAY75_17450 [Bacteroidetes bacterium]|nr:MAG: hypothetical protein EAY75_17450 [Bacteroidota bacterium]
MAEENGEPLDNGRITRYIVYVETASENPPPIKRLMVNGKTFETTATRITENPLNVGVRLNNDAKVCITTAKGRYLWMLDCTNTISNDTLTITLQKKLTKGQIVLLSEVGGEKYYDAISAPIELQPNLYM